jgi:hypothetical protein
MPSIKSDHVFNLAENADIDTPKSQGRIAKIQETRDAHSCDSSRSWGGRISKAVISHVEFWQGPRGAYSSRNGGRLSLVIWHHLRRVLTSKVSLMYDPLDVMLLTSLRLRRQLLMGHADRNSHLI